MSSALSDMCNARVGRLLKGKWKLERVLGIGGMAAVYEGVHHIGRKDAIKILHPEVARQPDLKRRFELEASATNRFRHKGAVEIRDFDTSEDGCPFMVMEMLDGESLGERVRRTGEMPERDLLRYVDQLLDVLVAAHREGIVHRDIKLDNVFITRDDEVKVLDFGVARILSGPVMTMAGTRLGTPAYMPPEQLRGLEVDGRADLFAVGATMFRLLTKRRIHEAPTEGQLILKMSTEPAPKTRSVEPTVTENTALVVDRALAFLASARYQNALTMQEDVREVIAGNAPPYASARARADNAGQSAPGPTIDRPTIADTQQSPGAVSAFAIDPTGATVHHRATATSPGADTAIAAFATSPTSATMGGELAPVSVRIAPAGAPADPTAATVYGARASNRLGVRSGRGEAEASNAASPGGGLAGINATIAADPAPFSVGGGAAVDPMTSHQPRGHRAIAATAPMPPSTPTPFPSSSGVAAPVAAVSGIAWQPRASGASRPTSETKHRSALVPIVVVGGLTLVVGVVGVALFLNASDEEAPSATASASASAPPQPAASGASHAPTPSATPPGGGPWTDQLGVAPSATPSSQAVTTATNIRSPGLRLPPGQLKKPK